MNHGLHFWRLKQAEKLKHPTAAQKTALGSSILAFWWVPFVGFIFVAPFIWAWLSLRYRWVSLAGIGVFVLMALPAFTQYGGAQGGIGVVFIGCMLLVWLFWFHRPSLRPVTWKGERVALPLGDKRLQLSYMHFTLWSWFNRKAPKNAAKRLTKNLMSVAYRRHYWGDLNPAMYMHVAVNAPGIYEAHFTVPEGMTDNEFMRLVVPEFEAALHFVRVVPLDLDARAGFVSVLFCESNPLDSDLVSADAPVLNMTKEELNNPYAWLGVGIDSLARPFEIPMFLEEGGSVRMLTAGASGSGKSSIVRQKLLFAVQNPFIDVFIMDGKGSEFGLFREYVQSYETTLDGCMTQLEMLEAEVSRRAEILSYNKETQTERFSSSWNPQDDGQLLYWLWDELGAVMGRINTAAEKKKMFDRIYGITSIARSLGIAVEFSSQTFKADLLETRTRDNCFDVKLSFKQETLQEAMYIGFDSDDTVRPDLISGQLLRSGRWSSVGQFATKGLGSTFGKSFYITDSQIKAALATVEPITDKGSDAEVLTLVK